MTKTRYKTGPAWAEFSDGVLESVQTVRIAAIDAPCCAAQNSSAPLPPNRWMRHYPPLPR
jgi:hypothetical protein